MVYFPASLMIGNFRSQPPPTIGSRSSPNCRTCFAVEVETVSDVGFEVIWFVVVHERNCCWCWPTFVFWIGSVFSFGCCISRWNWTDVIIDLERKCWTVDWLLMLEVILIPWILHHSTNHRMSSWNSGRLKLPLVYSKNWVDALPYFSYII